MQTFQDWKLKKKKIRENKGSFHAFQGIYLRETRSHDLRYPYSKIVSFFFRYVELHGLLTLNPVWISTKSYGRGVGIAVYSHRF